MHSVSNKRYNKFEKEYFIAQAITLFFASFLFMRGYALSLEGVRSVIPYLNYEMPLFWGWIYILLSMMSLGFSIFLCVVAYCRPLRGCSERIMNISWFPVQVISLAVFVVSWLGAIGDIKVDNIFFLIFFWAGLAWFLFICVDFVISCWQRGWQMSR